MWDVAIQHIIWERESGKASTDSSSFYLQVTHATSVHISLAKGSHTSQPVFKSIRKYNPSVSRDIAGMDTKYE